MGISKLNPSAGGIPFGNTAGRPTAATGKLYSNGETARLELYTSAGAWENIVQEVPGVSSISGAYNESTGSATLTINGTNFVSGAIASAIGTNAVEVQASSTTFNSLVQLSAVFTGLSNANEPYDIKVTNPSNLFGLLSDALYINASPVWTTAAGSLGSFAEQVAMSVSATATDESSITYSLASGSSLPTGITLNSSTGAITGTLPDVASNTTYTFTINASDSANTVVPRTFSFISNAAPVWVTSAGSLGTFNEQTSITLSALSATDSSDTVTYALASGSSLPSGVTLNSNSGVISGTLPDVASDTTYTFTINATDGLNIIPRTFSILSRTPISAEYLVVAGGGGGGGRHAGAGGAGGMLSGSISLSAGSTHTITVGNGGLGSGNNEGGTVYYNGENSVFSSITSIGGGKGSQNSDASTSGGSGGGGNGNVGTYGSGSAGTGGQGNSGGNGGTSLYAGGGGGGAGGAGQTTTNGTGGAGGTGLANSITGVSVTYAGGGGGGGWEGNPFGAGGSGGGGAGSGTNGTDNNATKGIKARNGTDGLGGGGGGGGVAVSGVTGGGGNGGSGVVIIAYSNTLSPIATIPGTLTYTLDTTTRSGYKVYKFTAGSGTVTI